jgi:hypothetical protein
MTDEVDLANINAEMIADALIATTRRLAAQMPVGKPGTCRKCGEHSKRLVKGNCAPCRDRFGLE